MRLGSQRGVALPMAMLSLFIVGSVVVGFTVLSATEPTIANNQLRVAQARALAEAAVERAIWALNNPTDAQGIPLTFTTAPTPYDGTQLVMVGTGASALGGFRVRVSTGAVAYERNITAVGWVPNDTGGGPTAVQKITATALNPRLVVKDPPAALSVRGELWVGGNSLIDAQADQRCGRKTGILTRRETSLQSSAADIRGATDDNNTRNQVTDAGGGAIPATAGDIVQNVSTSVFDEFLLSDADLDALRAFAKARGTYLRGVVRFDASRRMPNGLVFVDTVSGSDITADDVQPATPAADFASVEIGVGAPADPSGIWSGWLIVNGSVTLSGGVQMTGLVYAQNSLSYDGPGTSRVSGAMITRNIRDSAASRLDPGVAGNVAIAYNCHDARSGGDTIPSRWTLKSGSYKEVSGL